MYVYMYVCMSSHGLYPGGDAVNNLLPYLPHRLNPFVAILGFPGSDKNNTRSAAGISENGQHVC